MFDLSAIVAPVSQFLHCTRSSWSSESKSAKRKDMRLVQDTVIWWLLYASVSPMSAQCCPFAATSQPHSLFNSSSSANALRHVGERLNLLSISHFEQQPCKAQDMNNTVTVIAIYTSFTSFFTTKHVACLAPLPATRRQRCRVVTSCMSWWGACNPSIGIDSSPRMWNLVNGSSTIRRAIWQRIQSRQ